MQKLLDPVTRLLQTVITTNLLHFLLNYAVAFRSTATTLKKMTFGKALELVPQKIGLRSLSKLKSARGGLYMGIHYNQSHFYLVLGTKGKPVTTPKGITVKDDPKGAWASISIACEGEVQQPVEAIDGRMKELLADNSEPLCGMKCTPEMIAEYKFYTPLAYSKEDTLGRRQSGHEHHSGG